MKGIGLLEQHTGKKFHPKLPIEDECQAQGCSVTETDVTF